MEPAALVKFCRCTKVNSQMKPFDTLFLYIVCRTTTLNKEFVTSQRDRWFLNQDLCKSATWRDPFVQTDASRYETCQFSDSLMKQR